MKVVVLVASLVGALLPVGQASTNTRQPVEPIVVVVSSGTSESVREAVAGVRRRLEQRGQRVAQEVQLGVGNGLATWRERDVDVFVAVGTQAAEAARDLARAPVVSALVLDPVPAGVTRATGVSLEFPVEQQVQWLRKVLPAHIKRVGVIYSPAHNERTLSRIREAARAHDLDIVARQASVPADIPGALSSLASAADVLWGIPDDVVMTPETARSILLFSMRNKLPLIGLSSAWVKGGALCAPDRDYQDLGAQAADQAVRILEGEAPAAVRPEAPRRLVYSINQRTADMMNLKLSSETVRNAREVIR